MANGRFAMLDFGGYDDLDSDLCQMCFKLPGIIILPGHAHSF
jgi:hypothetical protein